VCGEVDGNPGHAVAVRGVFHPPVGGALGVAFLQGFGVVAFAPVAARHLGTADLKSVFPGYSIGESNFKGFCQSG
jgi:hypothetical protein